MHFRNKAINSLALCSLLGSAQALDSELNNNIRNTSVASSSSANRRLQTEACTLLLKITTFEDGHEEEQVDCYDEETKIYSRIATLRGSENIQNELLSRFKKGELHSAESTLMQEGAFYEGNTLVLPSDGVAKAQFGQNTNSRSRRRLAVTGTRTYLAVRIVATDSSPTATSSQISDEWFGTFGDPHNYKSQIEACSYNAVTVSKFTGTGITDGVFTANIGISISGQHNREIVSAAKTTVNNLLSSLGLENPDHIMFCVPPGTNGRWIGWAYVNSDTSTYNNNWCLYPTMQMHEVGHNWDLAHSKYNGDPYADESGSMGYSFSYDDGPEKCYNAPKHAQLGWYSDRTVTVTNGWSGTLYGLSSYSSSSIGDAIILYIPSGTNGSTKDYYVSFNGASGINNGTNVGGDQVLVHYRDPGNGYGESTLASMLSSGTTYTGAPLTIKVNSISGSTFAQVSVGTVNDVPAPTPPTPSPTKAPTSSPTSAPTKAPTSAPVSSPVESPVLDDSSCDDFPDKFKFTRTKIITCSDMTDYRCSRPKGESLCPKTCGTTADWCGDNLRDARGWVEYGTRANGEIIWKGCAFVRRRPDKIAQRCSKGNIALACRKTCQNQ